MKITKTKLKHIIKEVYKELTPARPVHTVGVEDPLDDLLTELFNVRTRAKDLEQYEVAGRIDMAIDILETNISSGPR